MRSIALRHVPLNFAQGIKLGRHFYEKEVLVFTKFKVKIINAESAIRDGRHFKTSEFKRHTVADLIDRFITQWLSHHPKRLVKPTALLSWWKKRLGHFPLSDLTPSLIAEARDVLLAEITIPGTRRSPSTVNRFLAAFSKALTVMLFRRHSKRLLSKIFAGTIYVILLPPIKLCVNGLERVSNFIQKKLTARSQKYGKTKKITHSKSKIGKW